MFELKVLLLVFESLFSSPSPCERLDAPNAKSVGELDDECGSVMVDANVLLVVVVLEPDWSFRGVVVGELVERFWSRDPGVNSRRLLAVKNGLMDSSPGSSSCDHESRGSLLLEIPQRIVKISSTVSDAAGDDGMADGE